MRIKKYYLYLPTLIITILLIVITANSFARNNLEEIKILLKNGKYVRAEKLINDSIEIKPNNPELLFYRGIVETNIGKNDKAINTFRELTEKFPELPEPFNNLAVLYAEKGQFKLAKEILEQAIKTNPSYLTAHINLGDIFTKMASEAYNKALEIDESNNIAITKLSMITQLFNYHPNTKNTEIDSTKIIKKSKSKTTKEQLSKEILDSIENWRQAWEDKNMENYLASYASNFKYPNNMTKLDWEKYRTVRITSKKTINISLSNIKLKFKKEKIIATFTQDYKAGKFEQLSNKTLIFIKEDGDWVIVQETSG